MKNIFALITLFFSLLLQAQETYSLADVPLELMKNANSVILNDDMIVDVTNENKLKITFNRAIVVFNKKGRNNIGAKFDYNDDSKVTKFEAYIYDKSGQELEHLKKRDLIDISAVSGGTIYSDARMLYMDYTPTTYPFIVVFNYEEENNSSAFIPKWYPVEEYSESIKQSSYTIIFNKYNKPRVKEFNIEGFDIFKTETPTQIKYQANNIRALKYEILSQHFTSIFPYIDFALNNFYLRGVAGYAENWKEFGKWRYDKLVYGLDEVPEITALKINKIVLGAKDDREKARRIYQFVQNKTRYISVQLGIGGWKPYPASDVDKLGYGDCKGLTNYTKALLKTQGIESYYSVVWAGAKKRSFHENFASMQGNHVILNIPLEGEEVWLECTSQDIPFGFLGTFTDDRDVLVLTPEGGEIKHTKNYNYNENLEETFVEVTINRKGGAKANYKSVSKGLKYDNKYGVVNEKQEDINKIYKNKWNTINGYTIDSIQLTNDKEKIIFKENIIIDIPSYCISVGEDILVNVNLFNQNNYIPTRIKDRKYDLDISRGFEDRNTINITIPQGFKIGDLPEDTLIENKFGTYAVNYKLISETKLEYKRHLIIKKGTFPKEEYKNYRSFRRKISKLDNTKIIVSKNS